MKLKFVLPLLAILLTGCASLGMAPAKSFDQKWAYAIATTTALRDSTANALNAQQISSADAVYVREVTNETRNVLETAKAAFAAGDVATAESRLALATNVLIQLQSYLQSKAKVRS